MQIEDHKARKIVTNNKNQKHTFGIQASAKAFKILSDKLYSDKITAVIRELSTNALDAHKEAGNEKTPFDIHFPTVLNPVFYVRDYGIGLSPKQIETLYRTFFDSTKTSSNDFTGCLGVGSKSPFAYTSSFSVETVWEGVRYSYSCYKDENDEPTLSFLGQSKTDDPRGLKVSLSVSNSDIRSFSLKGARVLQWFANPAPNILGSEEARRELFLLLEKKYLYKMPRWAMRNKALGENGAPRAIMGNVCYPIDLNQLSKLTDFTSRDFVSNAGLDLFFDIGDIDIAPSREALSYDKKTVKNIQKRLEEVVGHIRTWLTKEVSRAESLWEAKCILANIFFNQKKFNHLSLIDIDIKWQGTSVKPERFISLWEKAPRNFWKRIRKSHIYSKSGINIIKKDIMENAYDSRFFPSDNVIFIFNDHHRRTWDTEVRKIITDDPKKVVITVHLNKEDAWAGFELIEALGLPEDKILFADELWPKQPKKKSIRKQNKKNAYTLKEIKSSHQTLYWSKKEIDLSNFDGYWVEFSKYKIAYSDGIKIHPQRFWKMIHNLQSIDKNFKIDKPIIGLSKSNIKKLGPKAIKLEDKILKIVKNLQKDYSFTIEYDGPFFHQKEILQKAISLLSLSHNNIFQKAHDEITKIENYVRDAETYRTILCALNMGNFLSTFPSKKLELSIFPKLEENYHLLFFVLEKHSKYNDTQKSKKAFAELKKIYNL